MREIMFRGKRIGNIEWVYGVFGSDSGIEAFILDRPYIALDGSPCTMNMWEVSPNTVGQYTGLADKNGVKIFEGDICDFTVFDCLDNDTQYRSVVVYSGSRFMLWKSVDNEYYGADGGFDLDWVVTQDDEFEIIGNIQDNPELLKETRNAPTN